MTVCFNTRFVRRRGASRAGRLPVRQARGCVDQGIHQSRSRGRPARVRGDDDDDQNRHRDDRGGGSRLKLQSMPNRPWHLTATHSGGGKPDRTPISTFPCKRGKEA